MKSHFLSACVIIFTSNSNPGSFSLSSEEICEITFGKIERANLKISSFESLTESASFYTCVEKSLDKRIIDRDGISLAPFGRKIN